MKTILMLPSWYPNENNKIAGSFFREQAIALQGHYNFIVIHYKEHKTFALLTVFKNNRNNHLPKINEEYNIVEYNLNIYTSIFSKLNEAWYNFKLKYFNHKSEVGVGEFLPQSYIARREKIIRKVLKTNNWNFDYVYGVSAQDVAIPSMIVANCSGKPYVLAEHGPFPWPGRTINNFQKESFEKCNLFLAISYDKIRQVLLQNIQLRQIAYIGNLVDDGVFKKNLERQGEIKTFVIVAAHSFYKQYSMFIKVFNELCLITQVPFKVIVAGYNATKGYSYDVENFEKSLKKSNFADRMELIPALDRSAMPDLYNRADAFIMTSIQEGQPVSAMEAGCCGLPVFSTRCGGVEDYISESEGRIYEITDYKKFALGLKNYLEGKITFNSNLIRENCVKRFGREAFINNFCKYFSMLDM